MIPSEHDPNSPLLLLNKHCQKRNWNLKVFPFWVKKKKVLSQHQAKCSFLFILFLTVQNYLFFVYVCLLKSVL